MRSFGPVVVMKPDSTEIDRAHCNYCIFRQYRNGAHNCDHKDRTNPRPIPDASNTPDWCEMKEGALRDASDMANEVTHYVMRWSGRKSDEPREIYAGIPSEAARQFRLASRDAKRGTVQLEDRAGAVLAKWPEEAA